MLFSGFLLHIGIPIFSFTEHSPATSGIPLSVGRAFGLSTEDFRDQSKAPIVVVLMLHHMTTKKADMTRAGQPMNCNGCFLSIRFKQLNRLEAHYNIRNQHRSADPYNIDSNAAISYAQSLLQSIYS